jgi:transposase
MLDSRVTVAGMDVHKCSVRLAVVRGRGELVREVTLAADHAVVERELRRVGVQRCCYEAGPTGFGLHRYLTSVGIRCDVVAPGRVWRQPGDRVKTDPGDARKLAAQYAGGMLEPIWVPPAELEALRDLVRCREDARHDRMRARHRLGKFLLRHDRVMPTTCWGVRRREWLGQQVFADTFQQQAYDDYLAAVDLVDRRIQVLERAVQQAAATGAYRDLIAYLRCLRGVDTLTAVGLVAEIGDFTRFHTAHQFMSFVGLVPSERSSGERRRQGSITKAGNSHARRLLVEAAWNHRRHPRAGYPIQRRRSGQDPRVVATAIRAEKRLHHRWQRMRSRGKHDHTTVVAVARELAGFVWAIATDHHPRPA